jgi:DNA-binding PadR family transcriptional regulator
MVAETDVSETLLNKQINWLEIIYLFGMVHTESFELTGFQRDLLYVIAGSDQPSGQTVRRKLEDHIDNVNHGRLYPNLDTLVECGLVEKGDLDQRTNYYEVTKNGEQLLARRREWENQYVSFPQEQAQQTSDQLSVVSSSSD